jgi:hypothetical protein
MRNRTFVTHVLRRCRGAAIAGILSLFASTALSQGGPYTVTNGHDHGPGSLRNAIDTAVAGDTILFADNVTAVVLTTGELSISKDLIIKGPGAKRLTIRRSLQSGTPEFRVLHVQAAKLTISGVTIANGHILEAGAGIFVDGAQLAITASAIARNKGASGPAINVGIGSQATITACTLSDNESLQGYNGGALHNFGTVTIGRSTLARNHASGGGGAILNLGLLTITNSTIAGNSSASGGGGIYAVLGDSQNPRYVKARNTIIGNNTAATGGPDFDGRLRSLGYNLIGDTTNTEIVGDTTGNKLNVGPKLAALADNGGPTMTRAPLSGSPVIDAGDAGITTKDQRGFKRPVDYTNVPNASGGDGSEIGAFELQVQATASADADVSEPADDE